MLLAVLLLQGCATNIYLRRDAPSPLPSPLPKTTVYVKNPELGKEFAALKKAGIVTLSNNPNCQCKLTLHKMEYVTQCGDPFIVTLITLGLVPVRVPVCSGFSYDLDTPQGRSIHNRRLPIDMRVSVWERIIGLFHSNEDVLAEGLARSREPGSK